MSFQELQDMMQNKEGLNLLKLLLAVSVWVVLNVVTVLAIQGIGTIQTNFPKAYAEWQWQLWQIFFIPILYPIFIFGLPIYISGIIPITINRIKRVTK